MPKFIYFFSILLICISCQRGVKPTQKPVVFEIKENIKIDDSMDGLGACEPSIVISPKTPNILVAGSILNRVYRSEDGGKSWTKSELSSSLGVYGDPVVEADFEGNFFYAHLSNPKGNAWADDEFLDRIVVQKSVDSGKTWSDGNYPAPNPPKDQDKEWMAVDPLTNDIVMCWTEFDKYGSESDIHNSRILFSRLPYDTDEWSDPIAISGKEGDCLDGDNTTEGAVPTVGPNGEIYVSWSFDEKIFFDRSFDGGKTWLTEDKIITDHPGGWDISIPGIYRCNGMPVTKADISEGPNKGRIYVNWSDQRYGEDDTDIWLIYSDDKGDSWTDPIRVNDDLPGKHQFFTWMDVDPMTGYVYIVFYDRRAYDDTRTDVYLAYSEDGGKTFKNEKVSESPFTPNPFVFFGDYNDISAYNGEIRPIWTRLDKTKLSVWTAIISHK